MAGLKAHYKTMTNLIKVKSDETEHNHFDVKETKMDLNVDGKVNGRDKYNVEHEDGIKNGEKTTGRVVKVAMEQVPSDLYPLTNMKRGFSFGKPATSETVNEVSKSTANFARKMKFKKPLKTEERKAIKSKKQKKIVARVISKCKMPRDDNGEEDWHYEVEFETLEIPTQDIVWTDVEAETNIPKANFKED